MSHPTRAFVLAQQLNVNTDDLLAVAQALGIHLKSHFSEVPPDQQAALEDHVRKMVPKRSPRLFRLGSLDPHKMPAHSWKLDLADWPGPDRARWGIDQDIVSPSPDGQFCCVLYSCAQVNAIWTVGLLALLKGPPDSPAVILRPRNFTCYVPGSLIPQDRGQFFMTALPDPDLMGFVDSINRAESHCVQWLAGGRHCVVVPFLFNLAANKDELLALTFLDVVQGTFAHYEAPDILDFVGQEILEEQGNWVIRSAPDPHGERKERRLVPTELAWYSWQNLKGTSPIPSLESLESLRRRGLIEFIETPYGPAVQQLEEPKERRWWQFWK